MSYNSSDEDPHFYDPPSPAPVPTTPTSEPTLRIVNRAKRSKVVVATKSSPDKEKVPHQWTSKQIHTLIQIRLSDSINDRFQNTKKGHQRIWTTVSQKLQQLGIDVDWQVASNKYQRLRREYTRRYNLTKRSGADPSPLHDWEFFEALEPSFRSCAQIKPQNVESSLSETPASSSSSSEFVFPHRRKRKTPADSGDDRETRFNRLMDRLDQSDADFKRFFDRYEKNCEKRERVYDLQCEYLMIKIRKSS